MRVEPFLAGGLHTQGRTDIAVAARLQVILKQQALDFTAFVGLLRLDVGEGEAQGNVTYASLTWRWRSLG